MKLSDLDCRTLLLDTCVLFELVKLDRKPFEDFFDEIKNNNIDITIDDIVTTEFLQGRKNYAETKSYFEYIEKLLGSLYTNINYLPTTQKDIIEAQIISNINNNIDPQYSSKSSLADNILIAKLTFKPRAKLFFATFNHQDFISPLMERMTIINIETTKRVLPLGIYRFNHQKYNKLKKKYGFPK